MNIGSYDKLPQYSVHGEKNKFYLWINEDGKGMASEWITGRVAFQLYHELKSRFKKNKNEFIELLKLHHKDNKKD